MTEEMRKLRELADQAIARVVKENQIQVERLTEEQVVEVFRQAILCGDITRLVCVSNWPDHAQSVIYLPYSREQELLAKIDQLTVENAEQRARLAALAELIAAIPNMP